MLRLFALVFCGTAFAEDIRFPEDAGVVDVTKPPYSAVGDGKTDCTAAIQKALDDHPNAGAIIYLPHGTYLISKTLKWGQGWRGGLEQKNTILQGQSRDGTVLKLADRAAGFQDPKARAGLLWTGQKPAQRFRNAVRNLTLDTGTGNPGAVGMQFNASNQGGVFDVRIRSGDGGGPAGLDMAYTDEIGPLLVRNLEVVGFDYGILTAFAVNSMTFEHIALKDQRIAGIENRGQVVNIRGLRSTNSVPAVVNKGAGMVVLLDGEFTGTGTAKETSAIHAGGFLFARNIRTTGYKRALERLAKDDTQPPPGAEIAEYCTHAPASQFDTPSKTSLNLPAKEPPELAWGDPARDWTSPLQHGFDPKSAVRPAKAPENWRPPDATKAIQAAIDSGKPTVYLPRGQWVVSAPIIVRGACRRLVGCEANIVLAGDFRGDAVIRIEDGDGDSVIVERLRGGYEEAPCPRIVHASRRALVLRNITVGRTKVGSFRNGKGAGPLFLDDVCGDNFHTVGQEVYARQLNIENPEVKFINEGGTLWLLGYKTERKGTLIETVNGGRTELLGGFCYTTAKEKHGEPMFHIVDSKATLIAGETCFTPGPFELIVRETRAGTTKDWTRKDAPRRPNGALIPLYLGGN
jgi:hypothetical protein